MAVPNTSETGGYLLPKAGGPQPAYGQELNRIFQALVVGLSGLNPKLVRPAPQGEPPVVPDEAEAWAAINVTMGRYDTFPALTHVPTGDGYDRLQRNERIEVLASFYDLGTNGLASFYAARVRDGLIVPQNLEPLLAHRMGLVASGDPVDVPTLFKTRWLYRVDLPFTVSREVVRDYAIENVESAEGTIVTGVLPVIEIDVQPPP